MYPLPVLHIAVDFLLVSAHNHFPHNIKPRTLADGSQIQECATMPDTANTHSHHPMFREKALLLLVALPASLAFLYAASRVIMVLPTWSLIFPVVLAGFPIWYKWRESTHYRRRVHIEYAGTPDSRLWHFWKGRPIDIILAIGAICSAGVLLTFSITLFRSHWIALIPICFVFAIFIPTTQFLFRKDVKTPLLGLFTRTWVSDILLILLVSVTFWILDFYFIGGPVNKDSSISSIYRDASEFATANIQSEILGYFVAITLAWKNVLWHVFQNIFPNLEGEHIKLIAYLLLFAFFSVFSFIIASYFNGVSAIIDRYAPQGAGFTVSFNLTLIFGLAVYAALYSKLYTDHARIPTHVSIRDAETCPDQTKEIGYRDDRVVKAINRAELAAIHTAQGSAQRLRPVVSTDIRKNIEDYLDWYFSITGEYERIYSLVYRVIEGANSREAVGETLYEKVIEKSGLEDSVARYTRFVDTATDKVYIRRFKNVIKGRVTIKSESSCQTSVSQQPGTAIIANTDKFNLPKPEGAVAAGAVFSKKTAQKLGARYAARLVSKGVFREIAKAATKVAAKIGTRFAAAGAATAACAATGPAAILCGIGVAGVSWAAIDKIFIEIEEVVERQHMRSALERSLGNLGNRLESRVMTRQSQRISAFREGLKERYDRFIPGKQDPFPGNP